MKLKEINSINGLLAEDINDELLEQLKELESYKDIYNEINEIDELRYLFNIINNINLKNDYDNLINYKCKCKKNDEIIMKLSYKIQKYEDMIRGFIDG